MRKLPLGLLAILFVSLLLALEASAAEESPAGLAGEPTAREGLAPAGVMEKLREGNHRYVEARDLILPVQPSERHALAHEQHPIAAVIACADSRVMVESIFDQRIGALFVNRVAGNLATPDIIGSTEYAVAKLDVPVVVVLGHTECGAVKGSLLTEEERESFPPYLRNLLDAMAEDLAGLHDGSAAGAGHANVTRQLEALRRSPLLGDREKEGTLLLTGAIYSLASGEVTFLASEEKEDRHQDAP